MKLTKEEVIAKGMVDSTLIARFPDEVERLAALNKAWLVTYPEAKETEDDDDVLELTGTVQEEVENGEKILILKDATVHGFNKCVAESVNPLKKDIEALQKFTIDVSNILTVLANKVLAKETTKNLKLQNINPRSLHIKDFMPTGENRE